MSSVDRDSMTVTAALRGEVAASGRRARRRARQGASDWPIFFAIFIPALIVLGLAGGVLLVGELLNTQ